MERASRPLEMADAADGKQSQNEMAASWQARSQTERGHSGRALSGRLREITTYICLAGVIIHLARDELEPEVS